MRIRDADTCTVADASLLQQLVYTLFRDYLLFHPESIIETFSLLNSVNSSSHISLKVDSIAIPSTCEKGSLFYEHQSLFSIRSELLLYHMQI